MDIIYGLLYGIAGFYLVVGWMWLVVKIEEWFNSNKGGY